MLVAQADLLLDRRLDDVAADMHPAAFDRTLADADLLLDNWDDLVGRPALRRRGAGERHRFAGMVERRESGAAEARAAFLDIDGAVLRHHLLHALGLPLRHLHDGEAVAVADALCVEMGVVLR